MKGAGAQANGEGSLRSVTVSTASTQKDNRRNRWKKKTKAGKYENRGSRPEGNRPRSCKTIKKSGEKKGRKEKILTERRERAIRGEVEAELNHKNLHTPPKRKYGREEDFSDGLEFSKGKG